MTTLKIRTLVLVALSLALTASTGEAGRRRTAKQAHDDRPITRAEVARALEPVLDRSTLKRPDGREITGEDIANLESVAIEEADEMAATSSRVSNLTAQIEGLREEIQQLQRRRRRHW